MPSAPRAHPSSNVSRGCLGFGIDRHRAAREASRCDPRAPRLRATGGAHRGRGPNPIASSSAPPVIGSSDPRLCRRPRVDQTWRLRRNRPVPAASRAWDRRGESGLRLAVVARPASPRVVEERGPSRPYARLDLDREQPVRDRSARRRVQGQYRLAERRRLRQPNAARDDRPEHEIAEVPSHLIGHLARELRARVVHRHEEAGDAKFGIERAPDALGAPEELAQAPRARSTRTGPGRSDPLRRPGR